MCIVAIAWQLFDDLPLVLFSNRDEFFNRPTVTAHQWSDKPIFAAKDEQSGGTWLGYHSQLTPHSDLTTSPFYQSYQQNGKWAVILNFRDGFPSQPHHRSRGLLVTDFLQSDLSALQFARSIPLQAYAGFNLILGDTHQAVLVNNRGYPPTPLFSGLHMISNGQPENDWFKSQKLRTRIRQEVLPLIKDSNIQFTDIHNAHFYSEDLMDMPSMPDWQTAAFQALSDTQMAPDEKLPDTGIDRTLEKQLSAICIRSKNLSNYGTRTQSILMQYRKPSSHSHYHHQFALISRELA